MSLSVSVCAHVSEFARVGVCAVSLRMCVCLYLCLDHALGVVTCVSCITIAGFVWSFWCVVIVISSLCFYFR